jgi:hypothetical protein
VALARRVSSGSVVRRAAPHTDLPSCARIVILRSKERLLRDGSGALAPSPAPEPFPLPRLQSRLMSIGRDRH